MFIFDIAFLFVYSFVTFIVYHQTINRYRYTEIKWLSNGDFRILQNICFVVSVALRHLFPKQIYCIFTKIPDHLLYNDTFFVFGGKPKIL